MNITVFISSPRENGNSDKLARAFICGAQTAKHKVSVVTIRDLNINGCIGCEYCYEHQGECIQNDDMQPIYELLANTDIIVFATPIYYQGFPSQLKAVVDRLYVSENRQFSVCGAILLATYASKGKEMSSQMISYFECLSRYHDWEVKGIICVSGLDERNDIIANPALVQAFNLGSKLC